MLERPPCTPDGGASTAIGPAVWASCVVGPPTAVPGPTLGPTPGSVPKTLPIAEGAAAAATAAAGGASTVCAALGTDTMPKSAGASVIAAMFSRAGAMAVPGGAGRSSTVRPMRVSLPRCASAAVPRAASARRARSSGVRLRSDSRSERPPITPVTRGSLDRLDKAVPAIVPGIAAGPASSPSMVEPRPGMEAMFCRSWMMLPVLGEKFGPKTSDR